jgi:antitoxin ParD1/3/4
MARTMTVDVGDELREFIDSLVKAGDYRTQSEVMRDALRLLREKQAESRLQALRDLLAEGISSGDAKPWNKDAFLIMSKPGWQMKEIELTPKQKKIWSNLGLQLQTVRGFQADAYIGIAAVFDVLAMHNIGTHRRSWETISARCRWNNT